MLKPLQRVLAGEAVWPPPVWLMRQAGRYLPEYRAVRATVGDFIALATTPALAAEVTLQPIRRYGFDAAILFSDILIVPWALGHGLEFRHGEGPVLPKLTTRAEVDRLDLTRVRTAAAPVFETVSRCAAELGPDTTLIGFAGSPFTVACYMVEGGGSKDFAAIRLMAWHQPDLLDALTAVLEAATIDYLSAQVDAGAEVVMLFDSWAGVLPPNLFARYVTAPTARIVRALRDQHPGLRIIGFPRLAGLLAEPYAAATGVDAVALDTGADLTRVHPGAATQGNLDPMALVAGGPALDAAADAILAAVRGRPHIFNLGHGIVPQTPPEHVAQLVRRVRHAPATDELHA